MQRMKLHMSGMKVPKLGSVQDMVYRQYLSKESQKETKKTQLLALLVTNSVMFGDQNSDREWASKVRKIWNAYIGLEYGVDLPENTEKEMQMIEYYESTIKHLRPKLIRGKDGKPIVSGLDSLR